jgi:ligand-binding sensor domain-containing protein/two-component sensor histidine kinase
MMRFGLTFFLFFSPFILLGQVFTPNPDWRFENFNSQNHFVNREISDLTVDKHGYVWTSANGLERFDGYKTKEFGRFAKSKDGLRSMFTGVLADSAGRIWVGSAGLCYYNDANGKFVYIKPDPRHNFNDFAACCVEKNAIWFVCEYGLAKFDLLHLKISFTSLTNIADPLCTWLSDENTLIITSREKVYFYHIRQNTYTEITLLYNNALLKAFAIAKCRDDVFLGTNYGLFTLKNSKEAFLECAATKNIPVNDLAFLPQDKKKEHLFIATEGQGLMVYNTVSKKIELNYLHDNNNPYSLPDNVISRFHIDKKGRLWMATDFGISMLDVNNQQLKLRFLDKMGAAELGISKIARDSYDSTKVWMSSYNRGMICVNWRTKEVEKVYNADPRAQKLYDFVQVSKNRWLITTQKKVMEWEPQRGVLSQKALPVSDSLLIVCNIRRLIIADANTCFITTNKGLFKYDLATHQITIAATTASEKKEEQYKYILLNGFYDKGELWIASRNGLLNYNIAEKKAIVYRGAGQNRDYFFFDAVAAPNNRIACGSGSGIALFDKVTKRFKVVNSLAGLLNPGCISIAIVNDALWTGGGAGILNYNLNTGIAAMAEQEASVTDITPSSPFAMVDREIVFGFRNGYAYFTPNQKAGTLPSNPIIENVYANNQPVVQPGPNQDGEGKLIFSHSDNSINIVFTAFLYTDPDHIQFRYRLDGAGPGWQYPDDERSANFAQLAPGNYTFYVQSGNRNGVWNTHLASFSFAIAPPYWETWWFRTLVTLVVALGIYSLYRYKINNLRAIERIRERIASDFHDDIGSALSSISIFSEVADKQLKQLSPPEQTREIVGRISFHSRAMLDAMDDIVWAVNPQNDHFSDLAVRMREFAIPLLEAKNIDFDIDMGAEILNTRIGMEVRKNIFMIFKECINNILKHSCCSAVKIAVNKLNTQLEFVISDNGKGFDINAPHSRNGLKNIQKRAAEIKGAIHIASTPGNGTVTRLLVNII